MPDVENGDDRKHNFRLLSAKSQFNYVYNNRWSSSEIKLKKMLTSIGLKEKEDYVHNFNFCNKKQTGYFMIDFLFFTNPPTAVELDSQYHYITGMDASGYRPKKDDRKNELIKSLGWNLIRVEEPDVAFEMIKEVYSR